MATDDERADADADAGAGGEAHRAPAPDDAAYQARMARNRHVASFVPHNQALGITIEAFSETAVCFRLPYDPRLVGNPDTGVLHGGVITALLDGCSGAAVFACLIQMVPIATLDLRIDYTGPATPGRDVLALASCRKLTRNVAFTTAVAYHDDPAKPIATAAGTFMLGTKKGTKRP